MTNYLVPSPCYEKTPSSCPNYSWQVTGSLWVSAISRQDTSSFPGSGAWKGHEVRAQGNEGLTQLSNQLILTGARSVRLHLAGPPTSLR